MSIISVYESDMSDILYKRFALLASSYLDSPKEASSSAAHIPLENLFRLLEMYRYDAFSDESRAGILAIENNREHAAVRSTKAAWHINVENALNKAMQTMFTNIPKEEAVEDLEETLRLLTANKEINPENKKRAKDFFNKLVEELK
jgi:hypothetical protein